MKGKLLLVEDDQALGQILSQLLVHENFDVKWVTNKVDAIKAITESERDAVILDIGLDDESGLDLGHDIIRLRPKTPLLFMTAHNTPENRLEAFELGALEFISKPFHLKELMIRLNRVLASQPKRKELTSGLIHVGEKTIELDAHRVSTGQGFEPLKSREVAVLRKLIESSPQVVSRDELLSLFIGDTEDAPTQRVIDNIILHIRQILEDQNGELIRSVRGVGYQWMKGSK